MTRKHTTGTNPGPNDLELALLLQERGFEGVVQVGLQLRLSGNICFRISIRAREAHVLASGPMYATRLPQFSIRLEPVQGWQCLSPFLSGFCGADMAVPSHSSVFTKQTLSHLSRAEHGPDK